MSENQRQQPKKRDLRESFTHTNPDIPGNPPTSRETGDKGNRDPSNKGRGGKEQKDSGVQSGSSSSSGD